MDIKIEIQEFIDKNKDEKRADLDRLSVSTKYEIQGIKTQLLQDYAKQLAKENVNIKDLPLDFHEEIILAGFVIAYKNYNFKEKEKDLKYLFKYIDNWYSCDLIASRLKNMESEHKFFEGLLFDDNPFVIRFAIIWMMKFMLKVDLKRTVCKLREVKNTTYYVQMALSTCYTEAFLYDFDYMYEFIETVPRTVVRNRALQKACVSTRITQEQKVLIKKLRSRLLGMEIL